MCDTYLQKKTANKLEMYVQLSPNKYLLRVNHVWNKKPN